MDWLRPFMVIVAATGLVTTLVLPGRQTPAVVKAGTGFFTGVLKTSQGR